VLVGSPAALAQTILRVDASSTATTPNGTTWALAYPKLQDAIAQAAVLTPPVELWVADGVYYPDEGAGLTNNDQAPSFQLRSGVAIYGGFFGIETTIAQRSPRLNEQLCARRCVREPNSHCSSIDHLRRCADFRVCSRAMVHNHGRNLNPRVHPYRAVSRGTRAAYVFARAQVSTSLTNAPGRAISHICVKQDRMMRDSVHDWPRHAAAT
jgi:hypothetical protein